jgi:hypothetical protein
MCAGALAVLVGRPPGFAPMVGVLGGTNMPFVAGPIDDGPIPLLVRSEPSGAWIVLDGRERGRTPLQLHTTPGSHSLLLNSDATLPAIQPVELNAHGAIVDVALWGRHPSVTRLRPAYPGGQLVDAEFLADHRLAVVVALSDRQPGLPATVAREGWAIEPVPGKGGDLPAGPVGPRAAALAVSPDGRRVATIQDASRLDARSSRDVATGAPARLDSVWITTAGSHTAPGALVFRLPPPERNTVGAFGQEQLTDLAWLPDGQHLLVASRLGDAAAGGVVRTRLLVVDAGTEGAEVPDPSPPELIVLPAEVLLESGTWSADGGHVAVFVRAGSAPGGKNVLGLGVVNVRLPSGSAFQYLADLGPDDSAGPRAPVAPVAWEACPAVGSCSGEERVIYAAPVPNARQGAGGPLGLLGLGRPAATTPGALFVRAPSAASLAAGDAPRLGTATGILGPAWRSPGSGIEGAPLVGFERAGGALALHAIDPDTGRVLDLGVRLPSEVAPGGAPIGVRWDLAHARALVMARSADHPLSAGSDPLDVWLVDFAAGPREGT